MTSTAQIIEHCATISSIQQFITFYFGNTLRVQLIMLLFFLKDLVCHSLETKVLPPFTNLFAYQFHFMLVFYWHFTLFRLWKKSLLPISSCVLGQHGHLYLTANILNGGPGFEATYQQHPGLLSWFWTEEQARDLFKYDEVRYFLFSSMSSVF